MIALDAIAEQEPVEARDVSSARNMTNDDLAREPHPTITMLDPELEKVMGEEWTKRFLVTRREAIMAEKLNPLLYGYEPPVWALADFHRAELRRLTPKGVIHEVNLGGNRASKTERAAKRIIQFMLNNPGAKVWCCDSTEAQARANQMRLLWKYLPEEWRNEETGKLKATKTTKLRYTDAGGFTENIFVLPNGSMCSFKFYGMSVEDLEGPELDIIWADELVPYDWIETLVYRLVTRNGVMHITFTPKTGYTQTVGQYRDEAKAIEEVEAPLLPERDKAGAIVGYEKVPRVELCKDKKARIIYFHTNDNPYGNYEAMVEEMKGKPRNTILMRVYGVATKAANAQFPMFKQDVHVISLNRWMEMQKAFPKMTRYQLIDPCSGRNWFMGYVAFPAPKKMIVYKEWPSTGEANPLAYIPGIGDPGPWAVAGTGKARDGDRGPAQDSFGFGLDRYKQEMERIEKIGNPLSETGESVPETIFARYIDSRYANAAKTEREGTTTLIQQMAELGLDFVAMTSEKNILNAQDGSIDMINTALYYDLNEKLGAFSAELGRLNEPNLLVVECCPNIIDALQNWTGKDGQHGARKDPVDILRGAVLSELDYVSEEMMKPKRHSHFQRK